MTVDWTTVTLGVLSPLSALGGVCLTLYFQERRERAGTGVAMAVELVTSAEIFYHAVSHAAGLLVSAAGWSAAPDEEQLREFRDTAQEASVRWSEARSRATISIRSEKIRTQITTVSVAIGKYEEAYLRLAQVGASSLAESATYEQMKVDAWKELNELRALLRGRLARRF